MCDLQNVTFSKGRQQLSATSRGFYLLDNCQNNTNKEPAKTGLNRDLPRRRVYIHTGKEVESVGLLCRELGA